MIPEMSEGLSFRRAVMDDAEALTRLCFRAKAYWGYPAEWMEAWRTKLTVTPEYIRQHSLTVACRSRSILGFYGLELCDGVAHLEHLWVEPDHIGTGLGRRLFEQARAEAKARRAQALCFTADPNAEAFYLHMGAVRVGEDQRTVCGISRVLPKMSVNLCSENF